MKLRKLLLCGVCALSASLAVAQNQTFPFTLTTADGLPEQTTDAANKFTRWISPTYTFDEPVSSFRLTVTHTSWQDAYATNTNGSRGYVFFTMGEFYLYDAAGNQVELTADNFYSNAGASNEGPLTALCDGDESTHFHTQYSETLAPRPIGAEHYLEITLPEPMTSFSFGYAKRNNSANIPSEIIVTKGGVDADPYAEFGFSLGEKMTTLEPGNLVVFADEGQIVSDAWGEPVTTYLGTGKDPRYASPAGTDKYYRIRRNANFDCVFETVDAGDGKVYLKSYLAGTYIPAIGESEGSVFVEQGDLSKAGKFSLDEEGFLVQGTHYFCTNSQETLVAYDHAVRAMSIYKANINNAMPKQNLQNMINAATAALGQYKEAFADADQGETATLEAALNEAKAAYGADGDAASMVAATSALDKAAASFMLIQAYMYIDAIDAILGGDVEFGTSYGQYPPIQQNTLAETLEKLQSEVDGLSGGSYDMVSAYLANITAIMDAFYASKIETFSEWPTRITAPEGTAQLGVKTNYPGESVNADKYVYNSPTFVLEEPIERFYVTFVHTNDGDNGGGWECTALANFTVFDQDGNEVDLIATDFSTNAQEASEGPIENICDKNDDGTPNVSTFFHTLWKTKDMSTNEHWLCVELPQTLSCFSFQYITRGTGIAPKDIVVGPEPYHYEPDANVTVLDAVTSASELDPSKYYIFYGNIGAVDPNAGTPTGFYAGLTSTYGEKALKEGVFQLVPTETEGAYLIHFLADNIYLSAPTGWQSATATGDAGAAGAFLFAESPNLEGAFKVYTEGFNEGEPTKFVLQDWSGSMGYFTVAGEGFENDDKDGESDWTIYEVIPPVFPAYTTQVTKLSEINTNDKYAMFGNLEVVSNGAAGSGFYRGNGGTVDGQSYVYAEANNYTFFKLEPGANGGYLIHFVLDDNYLLAPAGWEGASVTNDPAKAGEFFMEESANLEGAFKIYAKGKYTGNLKDVDYTDADAKFMVQDWGDSMGYYPIVCEGFENDDTDGESDWTLFKEGDPSEVVLSREDYLGDYKWTWDNYWAKSETKFFEASLIDDPDSEDGVILTSFNNNGPIKGVFDGYAHTITFACGQVVSSTDQYNVTFHTTNAEQTEVVFYIDLMSGSIKASGQIGIENVGIDGADNGGWHLLSSSWVELVPVVADGIQPIVAADAEVVNVTYFTVGGQASVAPVQGVNIVRSIMSDGSVRVEKVLVK